MATPWLATPDGTVRGGRIRSRDRRRRHQWRRHRARCRRARAVGLSVEQNDLASGDIVRVDEADPRRAALPGTSRVPPGARGAAEREVLCRKAPHIIWPLRFVLPHQGLASGLDGAARPVHLRPSRRATSPAAGRAASTCAAIPPGAPLQRPIRARFEYSDCWVEIARLVVLNAFDAAERGADDPTRATLVDARPRRRPWRLLIVNSPAACARSRPARILVNAAGPWAGRRRAGLLASNAPARLRLVKGSHIVVRKLFDHDRCYIFQNADGRIVFAIPYERDFTLIGTTDLEFTGDPSTVSASTEEILYLCNVANEYFSRETTPDDVVWSFAGVRPLYDDGASAAQEATRDYVLTLDASARRRAASQRFRRQDHNLPAARRSGAREARAPSAADESLDAQRHATGRRFSDAGFRRLGHRASGAVARHAVRTRRATNARLWHTHRQGVRRRPNIVRSRRGLRRRSDGGRSPLSHARGMGAKRGRRAVAALETRPACLTRRAERTFVFHAAIPCDGDRLTMAFLLAIDQGTTSTRAILFVRISGCDDVAARVSAAFSASGWVEHDPEDIWSTHAGDLPRGDAEAGVGAPTSPRSASPTSARRRSSGTARPASRSTTRSSGRTVAPPTCARALRDAGHEKTVASKTGLLIDPYFSGTKIAWLLDHVDGARAKRAERGELAFGTVDSFLLWRLTGGKVHATDATNASRTLLYDIRRGRWDDELLALLRVPRALLPRRERLRGRFWCDGAGPAWRSNPDRRDCRRPACGDCRPGLFPTGHGEIDLRHGLFRAAQHRRGGRGVAKPFADDDRLSARGQADLCARGFDLRRGRGGAMVARRLEDHLGRR